MLHITTLAPDCKPAGLDRPKIGDVAEIPPGFDPLRFPIIARHFYGWRPVGIVAAQIVQDLKYRRKVKRLVAMGDRPVAEMMAEFAVRHGLEVELNQVLDRYLEIPDEALDVIGGRDFPPVPVHGVEQCG